MERYIECNKKSVFDFIKHRNFRKIDNFTTDKIIEIENNLENDKKDFQKLVQNLEKKIETNEDASEILKQMELFLPMGNNKKEMDYLIYNSKYFLDIFDCLNFSDSKNTLYLLQFIEKILRTNQNISKYIANSNNFLSLILKLMKEKAFFETCIRIAEEIIINSNEVVPLENVFHELNDIYNLSIKQEKVESFCTILAIMVFDNKKLEFKQIFKYRDYLKLDAKAKTTTKNQNICFHLPNILQELTNSLRIMVFVDHMSKTNPSDTNYYNNLLGELSNVNSNASENNNISSENNIEIINNNPIVNNDIFMEDDLFNSDEEDLYESDEFRFLDNYDPSINKFNKQEEELNEDDYIYEIKDTTNTTNKSSNHNKNKTKFKANLFQNYYFDIIEKKNNKNKNKIKKIHKNSCEKISDFIIYESHRIDKDIFFPIQLEEINNEKILNKKNISNLPEKILKIKVSNLIKYLDIPKNENIKAKFFNENLFGKLIINKLDASNFHKKIEDGKINNYLNFNFSADPFIYITEDQYNEIFNRMCFYKFSKSDYEKAMNIEGRKIFKILSHEEFMKIAYSRPFEYFSPNWDDLKNKHKNPDNIYNTYMKMVKNFKLIKSKSKISDNIKQYVQVLKYKSYQIEILFILSTLLGGKRKSEIQKILANNNVISDMNKYFEYNDWGNIFEESNRPFFEQDVNYTDDSAFHGDGCKCEFDVGYKVQYLRYIYSFCCRDDDNLANKLSLLSQSDLEENFSSSYFYYFYIYLNISKLVIQDSYEKMFKFNKIFDKFFYLEKKNGNLFKGFFDYVEFYGYLIKSENEFNKEFDCFDINSNKDKENDMDKFINKKNDSFNENKIDLIDFDEKEKVEIDIGFEIAKKQREVYKLIRERKNEEKLDKDFNFFFEGLDTNSQNNPKNFYSKISKNQKYVMNNLIQYLLLKDVSLDNINNLILNKYNHKDEECGLFLKLVIKYLSECYYSTPKFWLASCIEVMQRGNNSFLQYYLVKIGLMPCLLYDIIYNKNDSLQIMQLSFDILGEFIKFNRANFFLMNYYFDDQSEFSLFSAKIISKDKLVDSNVFLRSIILSGYFFDKADFLIGLNINKNEFFTQNCKFCKFLKQNMFQIFTNLINIVKPEGINQTNISCINTSLLILILNYLRGEKYLGEFLQIIRKKYDLDKEGLKNFRNLIFIWREFYNYRPKDSSSLQYSTTIEFSVWQKVANVLLFNDTKKKDSLFYEENDEINFCD